MKKRKYSSPYLARDYFSKEILPSKVYAGRKIIRQNIPYRRHEEIEFVLVRSGEGTVTVNAQTFPVSRGSLLCFNPGHFHKLDLEKGTKLEISECHVNAGLFFYLAACPYVVERPNEIPSPRLLAHLDEQRTEQVTRILDELAATLEKTPIQENQPAFFLLMKLFGILETYGIDTNECAPQADK